MPDTRPTSTRLDADARKAAQEADTAVGELSSLPDDESLARNLLAAARDPDPRALEDAKAEVLETDRRRRELQGARCNAQSRALLLAFAALAANDEIIESDKDLGLQRARDWMNRLDEDENWQMRARNHARVEAETIIIALAQRRMMAAFGRSPSPSTAAGMGDEDVIAAWRSAIDSVTTDEIRRSWESIHGSGSVDASDRDGHAVLKLGNGTVRTKEAQRWRRRLKEEIGEAMRRSGAGA